MKKIFLVVVGAIVFFSAAGQTSKSEKTGFWTTGSSWGGGTMPGTLAAGTVTATSLVIVIDGTVELKNNLTLSLSNLSINSGDTLILLGDLTINSSSMTNNGVLIVFGNVSNTLSNDFISGTGKMVVTGNYSNALGANTFTGPSYVYGATPGFILPPAVGDQSTLQSNDPGLYNYTNSIYAILPIQLLVFEAVVTDGYVKLRWSTASEVNNDHFILERSGDGLSFTSLITVPGAGTSKQQSNYEEVDGHPYRGRSYYRLSQVDDDGKRTAFEIISVLNAGPAHVDIFPNPTSDYLHVETGPESHLAVLRDLAGLEMSVNHLEDGKLTLGIQNLKAGVYILQLVDLERHVETFYRVVKQ